jgi:predicted MPP superfamily phosphohydrolase
MQNKNYLQLISILFMFSLLSCKPTKIIDSKLPANLKNKQIAFLSDVHFQDIYGTFSDSNHKGVINPKNGKYATIRTMGSQLRSTRLFNENYFAFIEALNDIVKRGVKYVVLPGDFSDDGQALNVNGIKKVLDKYSNKHGIRFITTTGNHDPCRPFNMDAGKRDFLGSGGKQQPIMSKTGIYKPNLKYEHSVVVSKDIQHLGYQGIINILKTQGFYPQKSDIYWETPFSDYTTNNYSYTKALKASAFKNRRYKIPPYNNHLPDVSYLVEPEEGLWFLAIDANTYKPSNKAETDSLNPQNYSSASTGYNNMLTHKKHLIKWVKKVMSQARILGKTVVAFSHYPMVEFNDDASASIQELMGAGKMQTHRIPRNKVAQLFADAGVKVHFAGHMHINDTGIHKTNDNSLINIQVPSLASYIPAYKLLTLKSQEKWEIETIILDTVRNFDELFSLYEQEYEFLKTINAEKLWNKKILRSKNYKEFTTFHLKELVRLRLLKNDWPQNLRNFLLPKTGKDLLNWANPIPKIDSKISLSRLEKWKGSDLIFDIYRLRNADKLAIKDIGQERINEYIYVLNTILQNPKDETIYKSLKKLATIFNKITHGAPANHFIINTKTGAIQGN